MSLQDIVSVQISKTGKQVTQIGFGTPLILGNSSALNAAFGSDRVRAYESLVAVAADLPTSCAEYLAAEAMFEQSPSPSEIKIGRRLAEAIQTETITPNVSSQAIQQYIETINGVAYTYTSDATPTAAEVVAGLIALINGGQTAVVASGVNVMTLTAAVAGVPFTHSESANLTAAETVPAHGIADDLNQIQTVDDDWYALMITSRADHDILEAAAWIETQLKMFCPCSSDVTATATGNTSSAFSQLAAKKYARTFPMWSDDQVDYPDAAWLGTCLPLTPGSETWAFKTLVGITASKLTQTQINALKAINCNYYVTVAGVDCTFNGVVSDNEYIDSIRFIDSFQADVEERIFSTLVNSAKIPYTDNGAAIIEGDIRAAISAGQAAGGIATDPKPTVTVPSVLSQSVANRQARIFPNINFTWRLAGAIQEVVINGNVSV